MVFGIGNGTIFSLDRTTGTLVWSGNPPQSPLGNPNLGIDPIDLVSASNSVFYYFAQSKAPRIYGAAFSSGELVVNASVPNNGLVSYASSDFVIAASDTSYTAYTNTGKKLWNIDINSLAGGLGDNYGLGNPVVFSNNVALLSNYINCLPCEGPMIFVLANLTTGKVLVIHLTQTNDYGPNFAVLASGGTYLAYTWYDKIIFTDISKI